MSDWIDGLLEGLARQVYAESRKDEPDMAGMLRAKLKPLLEAGEALASPYADGIDELIAEYRAAKAAALKEQST